MSTNETNQIQTIDELKMLQRIESRIVNMNLRLERTETRLVVLAKSLGFLDAMEINPRTRVQKQESQCVGPDKQTYV